MRLFIIMALILSQGLSQKVYADTWQQELDSWKNDRVKSLTRPHGWLSLIAMEWFHNGENTIGSAEDNAIILPHGPAYIGSFKLIKDKITFTANTGITISANDKQVVATIPVKMDVSGEPTVFKIDSFLFYVIERGKPALRTKDSTAATLKNFTGIDYFPVSEDYRVSAEFIGYDPVKEIEIINVLGLISKETSLGKLSFDINGKNFKLDVMDADDEYYIIFADKTSGRTTYGPGRFLYVPKPKQGNVTTIDFNKAYNPPCAFTDYSTCPLPPPQNRIPVYIKAGEKYYKR